MDKYGTDKMLYEKMLITISTTDYLFNNSQWPAKKKYLLPYDWLLLSN